MSDIFNKDLEFIFSKTKTLFKKCKKESFFITGGTGFFGRWFLESLLLANERLSLKIKTLVLIRDPDKFIKTYPHFKNYSYFKFIKGDVSTFIFPKINFENIIHAATETHYDADSIKMFDSNVNGTRRVLEFARSCNNKRLLFTSSGAVYGRQPAGVQRIREEYIGAPETMNPNSFYGQSKRASEFICAYYARKFGLNIKIARCFAFLGPHLPLDSNYAAGNFVDDALRGGPINVNGDGTTRRSYLYTSDLMIWLWTILFNGKVCQPYNVGSAQSISIRDLAYMIARSFKPPIKVKIKKKPKRGQDAESYVPDVSLANNALGLRQFITLNTGIQRMINFYQQDKKEAVCRK